MLAFQLNLTSSSVQSLSSLSLKLLTGWALTTISRQSLEANPRIGGLCKMYGLCRWKASGLLSRLHRRRVSGVWGGGLSPPKFLAECHLSWLWKTHLPITQLVLFILLSFILCKFNRFADSLVKLHHTALQHLQRLVTSLLWSCCLIY